MYYFSLPGNNSIILLAVLIFFIYLCVKHKKQKNEIEQNVFFDNIRKNKYEITASDSQVANFITEHSCTPFKLHRLTLYLRDNRIINIIPTIEVLQNYKFRIILPFDVKSADIKKINIAYCNTSNQEIDNCEIINL
jgi:hypothetical protein